MDRGREGARSRSTRGWGDSLPSRLYGCEAPVGVVGALAESPLTGGLNESCLVCMGVEGVGLRCESRLLEKLDMNESTVIWNVSNLPGYFSLPRFLTNPCF